jgi:signal transduction histidine kinase
MGPIGQVLKESQLFERLTDEELDKITEFCSEEVYEAGASIIREGEIGNRLYIVEEGKVVLEMTIRLGIGSGRQGAIDVILKGQCFGWWGGESYIIALSARSIEKTYLIAIDSARLWRLLEDDHDIGYKIMKRLVSVVTTRLLRTRDMLAHILSIASHDLKSPLAAVESYHRVMLDGYAGEITERQKTMLLRSSERITGLLNLIDNILDISRIDTRVLKMEAISLLKVVENSREVIGPLAKDKRLQLAVDVPAGLPQIYGDSNRLQQVFDNLLGNAVKFTPAGGTIALKVAEADDHIEVEVMDSGVGIPPEDMPKIFSDFYRGVRITSTGAGLGLAISKKIVEAHGGKIWAESPCPESGVGSKFTFTLPRKQATT